MPIFIPPFSRQSPSPIIRGWYNGPVVAAVPKVTPTQIEKKEIYNNNNCNGHSVHLIVFLLLYNSWQKCTLFILCNKFEMIANSEIKLVLKETHRIWMSNSCIPQHTTKSCIMLQLPWKCSTSVPNLPGPATHTAGAGRVLDGVHDQTQGSSTHAIRCTRPHVVPVLPARCRCCVILSNSVCSVCRTSHFASSYQIIVY
jgi:hypothetical protein